MVVPAIGAVHMDVTMLFVVSVRVGAIGTMYMTRRVIVTAPRAMSVTMIVTVRMSMRVPMTMVVLVVVRVSVMLVEHLLSDRKVFGKGRIVTVLVSAAIGARFGLERHQGFGNVDIEPQQHVAQHRIGFELEIAIADFHRGMPVAEVVRRAGERERRGRRDEQHRLGGGFHPNEATVVGHEHVAAAQHGAAWQE